VIPAHASRAEPDPTDTAKAWLRLGVAVLLSTIGGVGMWSVVVALPAIQADFGVARADATLPYTLAMLGFAGGGVLMGRLADRFGVAVPLALGTLALGLGYLAVGQASTLWQVAIAHGLLIGIRLRAMRPQLRSCSFGRRATANAPPFWRP
jgi:MFS family permease